MSLFNKKYNTIFIHVPKTAGTSIERFPFLGGKNSGGHATINYFKNEKGFENAFKFAFVRNPWDRYVSAWYHYHSLDEPFEIKRLGLVHYRPQHSFICDNNGDLLVDFIGRFETLKTDWEYICKKIGVKPPELPHRRKSTHKHYNHYYTPDSWEKLAKIYSKDIKLFGYGNSQYEN